MVFVDNSPDGTAEVVTRMAAEHPNIRCPRRSLASAADR
jgi:hypothetical protein